MNIKSFFASQMNQKRVIRIAVFTIVAVIAVVVLYRFFTDNSAGTRASAENVVITTSADKDNVTLSEEIRITSRIDIPSAQNKFLAGVDLIMTYDQNLVDMKEYQITDESLEQILVDQQTGLGKFRLMAGTTKSGTAAKANATITFVFTPKSVGTAMFEIEQQSFSAIGGEGASATALTYGPSDNGRTASVTIGDGQPTQGPTQEPTAEPTVAPSSVQPTDAPGEPTTEPTTAGPTNKPDECSRNREGDANCDDIVDSIDYVIWRKAYLEEPVNDSYDPDFNDDSELNLIDNQIWTDTFINQ